MEDVTRICLSVRCRDDREAAFSNLENCKQLVKVRDLPQVSAMERECGE